MHRNNDLFCRHNHHSFAAQTIKTSYIRKRSDLALVAAWPEKMKSEKTKERGRERTEEKENFFILLSAAAVNAVG
jgi:hypothetical protein